MLSKQATTKILIRWCWDAAFSIKAERCDKFMQSNKVNCFTMVAERYSFQKNHVFVLFCIYRPLQKSLSEKLGIPIDF